jgi:hypothetical protein
MKVWIGFSWYRIDLFLAFYEASSYIGEYIYFREKVHEEVKLHKICVFT